MFRAFKKQRTAAVLSSTKHYLEPFRFGSFAASQVETADEAVCGNWSESVIGMRQIFFFNLTISLYLVNAVNI
jgi:hypothetical protein